MRIFRKSVFHALVLVLMPSGYAVANIHGVKRLDIDPVEQPPVYDLDQIQGEVRGAIEQSERNLKIQVAILRIDPMRPPDQDCGNSPPSPIFGALQLACESLTAIENALNNSIRRDRIEEAVTEIRQAHVESDPTLAPDLAADVDRLLSSNFMQVQLAIAVADYVAKATEIDVSENAEADSAEHRLVTNLERVEAVASPVDSRVSIRLFASASLIRNTDETIIASYKYAADTPEHFIEDWSQGGIGELARSFSNAITKMAEVLSEEVLLTVNSPRLRRKGYLLEPLLPRNRRCLFGCGINALGNFGFYETGSLQPSFEWQDFRELYAREPLYTDTDASQLDVAYDVRIYGTRRVDTELVTPGSIETSSVPLIFADELLYEFRDIADTRFVSDLSLQACERYLWTVRARFVIDGRTHLTHWSGNYDEKDIEEYRQNLISMSPGARTVRGVAGYMGFDQREYYREESYYFPFLPSGLGEDCSSND